MALPISSVGPATTPAEPSVATGATGTGATGAQQQAGTGGLFGALLATETGTVATELAVPAEAVTEPAPAELTGLLAFAAQLVAVPANAAVAQANGETAAPPALTPAPADTRARADQLLLDRAALPAEAGPQAPATPAAPTTAAAPDAPAAPTAEPTEPTEPDPAARAAEQAREPRTGTPNIVAQPPLLTAAPPVPPAAPALNELTPPVAAPLAAVPSSALPDATLGSRPSTAGEQFAALASAGERLAAPVEPADDFIGAAGARAGATVPVENPDFPVALGSVALEPGARAAVPAPAPTTGSAPADAPPARVTFPAARGPAPAPTPAVEVAQPQPGVAQSALVIASARAAAPRLAPEPTDPEPAPAGGDASALAFAPSAVERPAAPAAVLPTPQFAPVTATRVLDQLADAVVARAEVTTRDGTTEFQLRLDPPELGRVEVKLVSAGDDLRASVVVADDAVRRLIESQLPELRQRLEAAGVLVQQFDVATDPNGGNRRPDRDDPPAFVAPAAREPERAARRPRAAVPAAGALDVTV